MKTILKMSDAVSLAFHAIALLASNPTRQISNKHIASEIGVSKAHLSKVLQRLTKDGLLKSSRGLKGGFMLGMASDKISLLNVFESIEGPFVSKNCVLDTQICKGNNCIFGDMLKSVEKQVYGCLSETMLSDLSGFFRLQ